MEKLVARVDEIIKYLSPLLKLANAHMVNFVTHELWDSHLPLNLRKEFEDGNITDILNIYWNVPDAHYNKDNYCHLKKFLSDAKQMSLNIEDGIIKDLESILTIIAEESQIHKPVEYKEFMSPKKSHEVAIMSHLVANMSFLNKLTHMIDIGDGKGYLSSFLALEYRMKVLGLDSSTIKTVGAIERVNKLKKVWLGSRKKNEASLNQALDVDSSSHLNKSCETYAELYKQKTEHVSLETNLKDLLVTAFPDDSHFKFGLIGLHTCGDLAPVCLRLFVKCKEDSHFLVNVGCCHHLLTEGLDNSNFGFPLSAYIRGKKFILGRNARMLSLQAQSRINFLRNVPCESLFYRAVLQKLLIDKLGKDNVPKGQVGRMADKCNSFVEYVHLSLKKLSLNHISVTDDEAKSYYDVYEPIKAKLMVFFLLRVSLAPIIENVILLDQLLFLKEQGIQKSYIVKLFDPVISPRCHGVIGISGNGPRLDE